MSSGDCFGRAKRQRSDCAFQVGQRVRIVKGVFADVEGCVVKGCGNGKWAIALDGAGDCMYVVVTDDFFEAVAGKIAKHPSAKSPDERS